MALLVRLWLSLCIRLVAEPVGEVAVGSVDEVGCGVAAGFVAASVAAAPGVAALVVAHMYSA